MESLARLKDSARAGADQPHLLGQELAGRTAAAAARAVSGTLYDGTDSLWLSKAFSTGMHLKGKTHILRYSNYE